jgi:class 3 adenylate cyclase/tetratricopeptide (TPR) repeat protein
MLTCPSCSRVNPAEASFCMGCGGPLGAVATAHETRKTVTALFCDLVGSTSLGDQHDPEVLRPLLDRYFGAMREVVERHGGRVEKFIGDAVAAVFGLPVAHEDDALRAVRAGMEMQAHLASLNAGSAIPLAARIGITTGEVLVSGGEAPLIGDAMNTASRLQSSAESGSVLIGEPTWRLVRDAVVAEPIAPLTLKGKSEPVAAYRVASVASVSPMRTRRLDAPMVGRRREALLLEDAFGRSASDRACVLFTVLGSAGAGKSRLVEEFLVTHADGDAEILRGRCLAYGEGITWYPVAEALRGVLRVEDFADAGTVQAAIHAAVGKDEQAEAMEANLLRLFGGGEGGSAEATFWALRRFLEARGRQHPVVLVLDDIHWGEPTFLDFVEHVADRSRDASILLLCMARPDLLDVRPAWGGGRTNAATISLAPLTDAECTQLIAGLLGSAALPDAVRDRITGVAEGNPLFVEEMLRMLVDDGRLVRSDDAWLAVGDLTDVAIPPTISALLSARLDRLSDDERAVVGAAAVEGKGFHRGAVAALLPEGSRADLAVHLRSLVRRELITPEHSSLPAEDAYRFGHQLIRDTAYDAIPKAERSTLHAAFADWLEGVAGERVVEREEIVGHHLAQAHAYRVELGLPEEGELRLRAAANLGSAGTRALGDHDAPAALRLLRSAAGLAVGDRMELQFLVRLLEALVDTGGFDESRSVAARLTEAAALYRDEAYGMRARMHAFTLGVFTRSEHWDTEAAGALIEEAIATYRRLGAAQFLPQALFWLHRIEWSRGRAAAMLEAASEALEVALEVRDRRWIGIGIELVMRALEIGTARLSEAVERATSYLEAFGDDPSLREATLLQRAWVRAWMGRGDEARADLAAGRAIDAELGLPVPEFYLLGDGYVAWSEGDLVTAEGRFRAARDAVDEAGGADAFVWSGPLARLLLELGRDADAADLVARFRDSPTDPGARIVALGIASVIAARRGDLDEALRLSDEARTTGAALDFLIDRADAALDGAEVLLLAGRRAEARIAATDALARYEHKEYAIGLRRAGEFLAALPG